MAFTLHLLDGAETGGLERITLAAGPTVSTAVRTGTNGFYCFTGHGTAKYVQYSLFEYQGSLQGTGNVAGFRIKGLYPNSATIYQATHANDTNNISMIALGGGGIRLRSSGGTTLKDYYGISTTDWSEIGIYWEATATGAWELFVDGVSIDSGTADFTTNGTDIEKNKVWFKNDSGDTNPSYLDDIYFGSGATSSADVPHGLEIFATVGDGSATTGGDTLDAGSWANVQEIPKVDANLASYNAPAAGNTDEREAPDTLAVQTNLTGAVTDIDDDPDSPDGLWLTASGSSTARVTFPTPTGSPTVGAALQNFRVLLRKNATGPSGGGTEDVIPDAITTQTGLTGAITDIDDDPDAPDGDTNWTGGNGWLTTNASNSVLLVTTTNPTNGANIDTAANAQTIKVFLRKNATGGSNPTFTLEVHDSGGLHETLATDVAVTTAGTLFTYTWTAAGISSPNDIQINLVSTKGGGGPNERNVEVDAVRWEMAYTGAETQPGYEVRLYENGTVVSAVTAATGNLTDAGGNTIVQLAWDATELGTADGSLVECYVNQTSGADRYIEVGAVEWNCKYPTPIPAESGWVEADSGTLLGPSGVSGLNEIVGLSTYIRTQYSGSGSTLTHSLYRGNDSDGVTELSLGAATVALADFFDITDSATIMPLITEQTRVGFGHPANVDVDIDCTEIIGMVAHVPSASTSFPPFNPAYRYMPFLVR